MNLALKADLYPLCQNTEQTSAVAPVASRIPTSAFQSGKGKARLSVATTSASVVAGARQIGRPSTSRLSVTPRAQLVRNHLDGTGAVASAGNSVSGGSRSASQEPQDEEEGAERVEINIYHSAEEEVTPDLDDGQWSELSKPSPPKHVDDLFGDANDEDEADFAGPSRTGSYYSTIRYISLTTVPNVL